MTDIPDWVTQTPNLPTLHQFPDPPGGLQQLPWQQLQNLGEFFFLQMVGQVAIALGGIEIAGWKPFEFLADWGRDLQQQAADALTKAGDAKTAAQTAQERADQAILQFAGLVDGVLGTGHEVADLVAFLNTARDDINATWQKFWKAVFPSSPGGGLTLPDWQAAAEALAAVANTAKTNADIATLQFATLVDNVLGTGHGAQDLAQFIIDAQDQAQTVWNNFVALINNLLASIGLSQTGNPADIPGALSRLMNSIFGQATVPSGKPPLSGQIDGVIGQTSGADDDSAATAGQIGGSIGGSIPAAPWGGLAIASGTEATGVPEGFLYYRVTALNASGQSVPSGEMFVFISPAWIVGKAKVSLSWAAVPGATSYRVYRGATSRGQDRYRVVAGNSFVDDGTGSWTMGTPPSAASRAGSAVASVSATANTAQTNATNAQSAADTAQSTADSALDNSQGIIDGINSAMSGGAASGGASVDTIIGSLQAIPQENILVDPSAPATDVTFGSVTSDKITVGSTSSGPSSQALTVSHTVAAASNFIAVGVVVSIQSLIGIAGKLYGSVTWTAGGKSQGLPLARSIVLDKNQAMMMFYAKTTIKGAGQVTVNASTADGWIRGIVAAVYDLGGVGSITSAPWAVQSGGTVSMGPLANPPHSMTIGFLGGTAAFGAASPVNDAVQSAGATGYLAALAASHQAGSAGGSTFSATGSVPKWAGMSVRATPASPVVGSYGKAYRSIAASGTTNALVFTGVTTTYAAKTTGAYYDSVEKNSDDLVFDPATGLWTVLYSGTYMLNASVSPFVTSGSGGMKLVFYNASTGVQDSVGPAVGVSTTIGWVERSALMYLKSGEKVGVAVHVAASVSNMYIGADGTAASTFFQIGLVNRSYQ